MTDLEQLLTENQLADKTGISPRTLQKWRWEGGGPPYIKLGRSVRYRLSDVLEWLDERTFESTSDQSTTDVATQ